MRHGPLSEMNMRLRRRPLSVPSVNAGGIFRIGNVLSRAWRVLFGNFLFFLGVPVLVYGATFIAIGFTDTKRLTGWFAIALALVLHMIGQAVLVLGAFQRLRGQPLRAGEALRKALARFFPLLGLMLLWCLAIGICLIVSLLISSFFFWLLRFGAITVLSVILLLASLVPPGILLVMWAVAVPVCTVEGLGPIASMNRSTGLTKGCRWKIFGIILSLGILFLGLLILGGRIVGPASALIGPVTEIVATAVGTAVGLVTWIAYLNCTVIMTYHDLRVVKEGAVDTEQIAAIFD